MLGQLMTTQTVLDAIPSIGGLLGFLAQSIAKVPGVRVVGHSHMPDTEAHADREEGAERVQLQVKTSTHSFGVLWVSLSDSELFLPYQPYLVNLINMAAVMLENRRLAAAREENNRFLAQAREALEQRVNERTRQVRQEIAVRRESEERYRSLFQHNPDAIASLDLNGRYLAANAAMEEMTGYDAAELARVGRHGLMIPERMEASAHYFARAAEGEVQSYTSFLRHKDGRLLDVDVTLVPIVVDGCVVGVYEIARDVTVLNANERRIEYLATHDALTGLPNRALLYDRLNHAIEQAERHEYSIAVLFLDLDRFKMINDSLGHDKGDLLLQTTANRLRQVAGTGDTVARLGGDEFVLVLENPASEEAVMDMANRVLRAVAEPFKLGGHELTISTSIGGSLYPRDGESPSVLLKHADLAMYKAKEVGRGSFRYYSADMNAKLIERLLTANGLKRALENSELVLHYQPRIAVTSGRTVGLEALVRWQHPVRGMISPQAFIPLAEEIGLIGELGRWVLRAACRQNRAWQLMGLPPVKVSVNLSAQQVASPRIVEEVRTALESSGLDARWLELELTESCLMQNTEATLATLQEIRAMGVTLSIDDFGTGYSSLSYLKRLPIDVLKIDQSFIRGVIQDPNDTAIVMAMISMAHRMDLEIVAEGVTSTDQADFLAAHHCDEMQGFLFSRPLPADEMEAKFGQDLSG